MARKQYRWFGEAAWMSANGNAALALVNPLGSGKKLLVHNFEVYPLAKNGTGGADVIVSLNRATVSGGVPVTLSPRDTAASLPSGIEVRKFAASDPASYQPIMRRFWSRSYNTTGLSLLQAIGPTLRIAGIREGSFEWVDPDSNAESVKLRPGESVTLSTDIADSSQLFGVSGVIIVEGSPNRTFHFNTISWASATATDIISFVNESASSVVRIKRITLRELGAGTSPFFQLVPVGAVNPQSQEDQNVRLTAMPMDTAYGALPANHAMLIADAPLLPYGVPEVYANDIGQGAPKGMSYLHTKDLVGPQFMVYFPELSGCANPNASADTKLLQLNQKANNLLTRGAPIVVREGEGLALVSAAETAGTTAVTPASGWAHFDFGIQFSVEPTVIPSINLLGIVAGSDVVILDAGTSDVFASGDAISGSTFGWEYDADVVDTVDICVYKQGYVPFVLRGIDPGNAGITLPVTQVADRNFSA